MSADNFMYVQEYGGRYLVTMEFASSEEVTDPAEASQDYHWFDSLGDALEYAYQRASGKDDPFGYGCEYGVEIAPSVRKEMQERLK